MCGKLKLWGIKGYRRFKVWCRSVDLRRDIFGGVLMYHRLQCQTSERGCYRAAIQCNIPVRMLQNGDLIQPCFLNINYSRRYSKWYGRLVSSLYPFRGQWFMISLMFSESSFYVLLLLLLLLLLLFLLFITKTDLTQHIYIFSSYLIIRKFLNFCVTLSTFG